MESRLVSQSILFSGHVRTRGRSGTRPLTRSIVDACVLGVAGNRVSMIVVWGRGCSWVAANRECRSLFQLGRYMGTNSISFELMSLKIQFITRKRED